MGKYKVFLATLSEEQRKQVERYTTQFYILGIVAGVGAALIWQWLGVCL